MAYVDIPTSHGLTQEQWEAQLYQEYLGEFPFFSLMGTSSDAVIQVKDDLVKKPGDAITIGIRGKLIGEGVTGNSTLKGNEEDMSFYHQRITIDEFRHGVALRGKMSQKRVAFNLRNEAKLALKDWLMEKTENDLITALTDTSVGRAQGRYLYGAADSNWNATHATALGNVDNTSDKLTTAIVSIAKRKAQIGSANGVRMRPFKVTEKGKNLTEKFIMFVHPFSARDLKTDSTWQNHQRDLAVAGMKDSIPWVSGSNFLGEWDGVYIYSYDRVPLVASTIQVSHNLLLGAQAAAVVWGERTAWEEDIDDYKHKHGFSVGEVRGVSKLVFDRSTAEDNGVVNVFAAAVADA